MRSIRTRMMVFFGVILLAICTCLGVVSYITASKALVNNVEETLPQMAVQAAKVVDERLDGILASIEILAARDRIKNQDTLWEEKAVILDEEVKRSGHMKMGIADMNGDIKYTNGQAINIKDREYFKKALSGEKAVSDPLLSKAENVIVVVYAVPIKDNGKITGVLVATRDGNNLSQITNDIKFGKSGNTYMINKAGAIIAHSDQELVKNSYNVFDDLKNDPQLKSLAEIHKEMVQGKTSAGEYTFRGVDKYLGYAPVKSTGWSIAVAAPHAEVFSGLKDLEVSVMMFSLLFLIIALVIVFFISKSLSRGIVAASTNLDILAKGDFTHEISEEFIKRKDEIGSIAKSLEIMKDSVRNMIKAVKESSDNIGIQSECLSAVAEQMSSSAENVTNAIQDVAKGTGSQAEELVEVSSILNKFGDEMEIIVQSIKDIDINTREINTMANESSSNMAHLSDSVSRTSDTFRKFTDKITGLGQGVTRINEITTLINSIADQTNLLALNASIEAARAGEAGRGFAVVADEIRKLAEQAKTSSESINNLVNSISQETKEMLRTTDIMSDELNNQVWAINSAVNSFGKIINAIDDVAPKIDAVNNSVVGLDSEKNTIIEKIESVSSIAQEVSASSEEIAASSEEMSASTQEVASSAQSLSGMAKDMMDQVGRFKL